MPDPLNLPIRKRGENNSDDDGEFKFSGASQEGTAALAATRISGSRNLNVGASLDIGQAKDAKGFDYRTAWSNSGNVSVRKRDRRTKSGSLRRGLRRSGNIPGLKRLNIFSS
jgi:hypothetical protein